MVLNPIIGKTYRLEGGDTSSPIYTLVSLDKTKNIRGVQLKRVTQEGMGSRTINTSFKRFVTHWEEVGR